MQLSPIHQLASEALTSFGRAPQSAVGVAAVVVDRVSEGFGFGVTGGVEGMSWGDCDMPIVDKDSAGEGGNEEAAANAINCCCCCCWWWCRKFCTSIISCLIWRLCNCCCCCACCWFIILFLFRRVSDSQGLGAPGCLYETCFRRASLLRDTWVQTVHAYLGMRGRGSSSIIFVEKKGKYYVL